MKIKKFNNLWTMGLIICGVILVALYVIKIAFPDFIVGVAEVDGVVKFGNYVDSHLWAYYIFTFIASFFIYYFYTCACCRKKFLNWKDLIVVFVTIVILFLVQKFLPDFYLVLNVASLIVVPACVCALDKRTEAKYLYSTAVCFVIHNVAEVMSLFIRDISTKISYPNIATLTILLIDLYIWQVLLYNYYNFKEAK